MQNYSGIILEAREQPPPPPPPRSIRKPLLVIAAALALVAITSTVGLAIVLTTGLTSPPPTLKERTDAIATALRSSCDADTYENCTVISEPGEIEVTVDSEARLRQMSKEVGLFTSADVARMLHTRALDGTQRTADGKVSWTYHPDDGMQLVITIDESSPMPSTTVKQTTS